MVGIVSITRLTQVGEALIHLAIAIVVQPIANFGNARWRFIGAKGSIARGVTRVGTVCTLVGIVSITRLTQVGEVLIHLAIAIVVQSIANFGNARWRFIGAKSSIARGVTREDTIRTLVGIVSVTRLAEIGKLLIRLAIAIVVQPIARLNGRNVLLIDTLKSESIGRAGKRPQSTAV